jgi:hypothetical protein
VLIFVFAQSVRVVSAQLKVVVFVSASFPMVMSAHLMLYGWMVYLSAPLMLFVSVHAMFVSARLGILVPGHLVVSATELVLFVSTQLRKMVAWMTLFVSARI